MGSHRLYLFLVLILISCRNRTDLIKRSQRQLRKGKITLNDYRSSLNAYYVLNNENFVFNSKVKVKGSYIKRGEEGVPKFVSMKFTDSGTVYISSKLNHVSNKEISETQGVTQRYILNQNQIATEFLSRPGGVLYNIFRLGTISRNGDTIKLLRQETLKLSQSPPKKKYSEVKLLDLDFQNNKYKSRQIHEVYIYNSNITQIPKLYSK